jgi:hypothetical protein
MKALRTLAVAAALLCVASVALAAVGPDVGVYFDDQGTETSISVQPYEQFAIHVVMTNINDRVNAVEYKLDLPADLIVTSAEFGGPSPIALGNPSDGYAIGLGECVTVYNDIPGFETLVVETRNVYAFQHFNATSLTLEPFQGPGQEPGVTTPRYANCQDDVFNLNTVDATVAAPVATDQSSWTSVKAMY